MTDVFDRASEREEEVRSDALAEQARRAGLAGKTVADSAMDCSIRDGRIPEARRIAIPGVQTCVGCQQEIEYAERLNALPINRQPRKGW